MVEQKSELLYPLANQEINPSTAGFLKYLVIEEKEAFQSDRLVPTSINTRKELLEWFKGSGVFEGIYSRALKYLLVPRTDEKIREFKKDLAGDIYEKMTYAFLAKRQPPGKILLSPERTQALFQNPFPEAHETPHPFGASNLKRIFIPDGVQIKEEENKRQITNLFEFTLAGSDSYFKKKLAAFSDAKKGFPQLLDNAGLIFVTPSLAYTPKVIRKSGAQFSNMSFTHRQFRNFFNGFFKHYRLEADYNNASLYEIQELARKRHSEQEGHK